ncbi:hypothetical protein [Nonlabens sp.]|uniref:hypothetical protein n=1 Tax=Nonlabens sp. TaxID=1888209 RepID=UPI001BCDF8CC|nr:hypothetical protein [Nonlabens sp.]
MKNSKSKNNPLEKRVEYRGENIRASRTGGVSATATSSGDGYAVTVNTKHGVRFHKRLFHGVRAGFQRGNFQFIGRYRRGPFNFNVSKRGASSSIKHAHGSFNIIKPNYSSFKLAGVQLRGKNAILLHVAYLIVIISINSVHLLWQIGRYLLWLVFLTTKWFFDFLIGCYNGMKNKD